MDMAVAGHDEGNLEAHVKSRRFLEIIDCHLRHCSNETCAFYVRWTDENRCRSR
jgi:hypothetical protein